MLPLSDGLPARRFPVVNILLIVAMRRRAGRLLPALPGLADPNVDLPDLLLRIPAWIFLAVWFLYRLIEASLGLFSASANGDGVAFFAHVGGFVFGLVVTWLLARAGQVAPQELERSIARPAGSFPRRAGRRRTPERRCVSASYRVRSKLS